MSDSIPQKAYNLRHDAAFIQAVDDIRDELAKDFFASRPDDPQVRELLHARSFALDYIINKLDHYYMAALMQQETE